MDLLFLDEIACHVALSKKPYSCFADYGSPLMKEIYSIDVKHIVNVSSLGRPFIYLYNLSTPIEIKCTSHGLGGFFVEFKIPTEEAVKKLITYRKDIQRDTPPTHVGVTGHRPDKLWGYDTDNPNYERLRRYFRQMLMELNCGTAHTGMAIGTDIEFAKAVLEMKDYLHKPIELVAHIPCDNQQCKWPRDTQLDYEYILSRCSEVTIVSPGPYAPWKMQKRNEHLVNSVDHLIAVYDGSAGGTGNCVGYARNTSVILHIVTPKQIEEM